MLKLGSLFFRSYFLRRDSMLYKVVIDILCLLSFFLAWTVSVRLALQIILLWLLLQSVISLLDLNASYLEVSIKLFFCTLCIIALDLLQGRTDAFAITQLWVVCLLVAVFSSDYWPIKTYFYNFCLFVLTVGMGYTTLIANIKVRLSNIRSYQVLCICAAVIVLLVLKNKIAPLSRHKKQPLTAIELDPFTLLPLKDGLPLIVFDVHNDEEKAYPPYADLANEDYNLPFEDGEPELAVVY